MEADLIIHKLDETNLLIDTNPGIEREIQESFSFMVPGYKYMPKFKQGIWDGSVKLFDKSKKTFYVGLLDSLLEFAHESGYTVDLRFEQQKNNVTREQVAKFAESLNLHAHGDKIELEDHQLDAVHYAIANKRGLILSPTSSGKSLIIYTLCRILQKKKILIVVPTTALVEQMEGDFADYSSEDDSWDAVDHVHKIYSGKEKETRKNTVVSTWQSIYKKPKSWFEQFDVVMVDECQGAKSNSLTNLMKKSTNAAYKFGFTGTLDGTETNEMVLRGLFGPIKRVITTRTLMEKGVIAWLKVKGLVLNYNPKDCQEVKGLTYQQEVDWLVTHPKRMEFIAKLALAQESNTIVLFQYVEKQGKPLHDLICELNTDPDRPIFYISGEVSTDERERIRKIMERENNVVLVASSGTMSTGTNIRNLHSLILASGGKSRIKVLQSIGRTLRKHNDKSYATVYDIADNLKCGTHENYGLRHFRERQIYYREEQFPFKTQQIKIT